MRPVIIAANWKMNTTPADAGELAAKIAARTEEPGVVRVICPPFVCLSAVRDALAGKDVFVGAQNVHHELAGAYTGETSAASLAGLATWVILGHSERRRDAFESDELIGKKLARAVASGLRPILCVGELLAERESGRAVEVVSTQLRGALAGKDLDALLSAGFVIAYEPVWAIGTGRTASAADAAAMAEAIRSCLSADLGWGAAAESVPVLYGGSVTSANIGEFLAEHSIDGGLVGGASLKPDEMAGMVASVLPQGTKNKTPEELEEQTELLGSSINMYAGREEMTINASALSRNFDKTAGLMKEIILEPRWDTAEFSMAQTRTRNSIIQAEAQPGRVAGLLFNKLLYGTNNILGINTRGTRESINKINLNDLKTYYENNFSPSITKILIAGNVPKEQALWHSSTSVILDVVCSTEQMNIPAEPLESILQAHAN